jgi:signal transduction histidine kinase
MTTSVKTTAEVAEWSRRYQAALRRFLKTETAAGLRAAQRLGRQAVSLGMETLDVARVHEQALSLLATTGGTTWLATGLINHAKSFFEEAVVPIEQTHDPALCADAKVTRLTQSLRQRTQEAAESTKLLEKGVARRQAAETALKTSVRTRAGLLAEAQRLRLHLQNLTREILAAQEYERKKTGEKLSDDIAQLLLAIQIRLLALDGSVTANSENLKTEIAVTQRIVKECVRTFYRLAIRFEVHHEA